MPVKENYTIRPHSKSLKIAVGITTGFAACVVLIVLLVLYTTTIPSNSRETVAVDTTAATNTTGRVQRARTQESNNVFNVCMATVPGRTATAPVKLAHTLACTINLPTGTNSDVAEMCTNLTTVASFRNNVVVAPIPDRFVSLTAHGSTVVVLSFALEGVQSLHYKMNFSTFVNSDPGATWLDTEKLVENGGANIDVSTSGSNGLVYQNIYLMNELTLFSSYEGDGSTSSNTTRIRIARRVATDSAWSAFADVYTFPTTANASTQVTSLHTMMCPARAQGVLICQVGGRDCGLGVYALMSDATWQAQPVVQHLTHPLFTTSTAMSISPKAYWLMVSTVDLSSGTDSFKRTRVFYYQIDPDTRLFGQPQTLDGQDDDQSFLGCAGVYCADDGSALMAGDGSVWQVPPGGNLAESTVATTFPKVGGSNTTVAGEVVPISLLGGAFADNMVTARTGDDTIEFVYGSAPFYTRDGLLQAHNHQLTKLVTQIRHP
jgi:hypothetical protein